MDRIAAAQHDLKLTPDQIKVASESAIYFAAERQFGSQVVEQRRASGEDATVRGLDAQYTGAGVAGEQNSGVHRKPGFIGELFLSDDVESVIYHTRA